MLNIHLLQSRPDLLNTLRKASNTGSQYQTNPAPLGSKDTPVFQRLATGCFILFFLLPFLGTFLAFFVEACFG